MTGVGKFLGGVVSGGLVAGVTLVVMSQLSTLDAPVSVPADTEVASAPSVPQDVPKEQAAATTAPASSADAAPETGAKPVEDRPAAQTDDGALPPVTEGAAGEPAVVVDQPQTEQPADLAAAPKSANAADQTASTSADAPPAAPQLDVSMPAAPESTDQVPIPAAEVAGSLTAEVPAPPAAPLADGTPPVAELPPPPPLTNEEVAVLADPTLLTLPGESAGQAAVAGEEVVIVDEPVLLTPAPDSPVPETRQPEAPAPETDVASAGSGEEDVGEVVQSPVLPGPKAEADPAASAGAAEETLPVVPEPGVAAADQQEVAPDATLPDTRLADERPSTFTPTPGLSGAGEGSLIDRAAEAEAEEQEGGVLPEVDLEDAPALKRFAADFTNPEAKPLFSILLLDTGDAAIDRQAVASLPFPVSIVIDPLSPEASAHAALYRAGGKEVVMLATGIPDGATPADVEQTFQAHAATLPEAVAVVDGSAALFQGNRPLATQIVPILAAQGRGLLTWDRGLNAADQVARREGLPTAMIFRQIDAEDEAVPVMRRYLDRAAFRAAQEGEVIVFGTAQAKTIAALLEWTIEGRASSVALAPASALLIAAGQ